MNTLKGQLTLRGVIVGCLGCAIITASSVYVALRMGALPWPIIFAAIVSLFGLKLLSRGTSTLNEANVTHTVMSAGAMVAGGLAFTIPGAWMLGLADEISWVQMLVIALAGSALGLVGSVALRKHFVEDEALEFPIGEAAAQTLKAGDVGGRTGAKLFGALGFAGIYTLLRDALGVLPKMLCQLNIPGVVFGIFNSPMMLSVGFLVGTGAVVAWFAGAVFANFGIIVGAVGVGLFTTEVAQQIVSCLGMGCMMGCGVAVIVRDILPRLFRMVRKKAGAGAAGKSVADADLSANDKSKSNGRVEEGDNAGSRRSLGGAILVMAAVAIAVVAILDLPVLVAVFVVLAAFVACAMSAQSVGQTGIDPMEIFGLIVLLLVSLAVQLPQTKLFFIAALVAVACGLAGDVMNDFKAGSVLGTSPKAQWVGQAIGAVIGSVVAVATMCVLLNAFGPDAFGPTKEFVSAQASVVATMVSGIPNIPAFVIGLVVGFALYILRLPSMMIGLGVYLPFYMSFTAFLGAMVKLVFDFVLKRHAERKGAADGIPAETRIRKAEESGLVIASGLLGGESIIGIILALVVSASMLAM